MQCYKWQDWREVLSAASVVTFTQAESEWMDLRAFQDVVVWLQVGDANNGGGTGLTIAYQTSPNKEDILFAPLNFTSAAVTPGSTVVSVFPKVQVYPPIARWLRWQLTASSPTGTWGATFRLFVSANAAPCMRPTSMLGTGLTAQPMEPASLPTYLAPQGTTATASAVGGQAPGGCGCT